MPASTRGPFWARGRRGDRTAQPFWIKQRPHGPRGPRWLRPGRADASAGSGGGAGGAAGTEDGARPRRGTGSGGPAAGGSAAAGGRAMGGVLSWLGVRAAALLAIVAVLAGAAGILLQRADSGPVAARARSTGHDALWLGSAWLDGRRGPGDLRLLTARIRGSGIGDVYVFAGGLDAAGRLAPARYAGAARFLASFRAACPKVRASAWLGGVTGAGHLDLGDPATRRHIVASAAAVLRAGFTGVQYSLQPVTSGDPGLLALLGATRRLGADPLSVTAPKLEPLPGLRLPARLATGRPVFWTPGYLTQVADRVDQVAMMSYGTGLPFPSWYGGYVERETALTLRAVRRQTALLMAVPAFHKSDLGHHPGAETVAAAIHGIRVALTAAGHGGTRGGGGVFGVGLFADDTATSGDWASYLHDWVRPG